MYVGVIFSRKRWIIFWNLERSGAGQIKNVVVFIFILDPLSLLFLTYYFPHYCLKKSVVEKVIFAAKFIFEDAHTNENIVLKNCANHKLTMYVIF